jgi:hypothetical protein
MDTNYQTRLSEVDATLELIMDSDDGNTPADDRLDASEDVPAPAPLTIQNQSRSLSSVPTRWSQS